MRILHCIPSLEIGGAERQLSLLAPALAQQGHEVHVVLVREGRYTKEVEGRITAIHRLRGTRFGDPWVFPGVRRVIDAVRPDIVQSWLGMNIVCGMLARTHEVPWVASVRSLPLFHGLVRDALERSLWVNAAAVVSNSRSLGEQVARLVPTVSRAVIPNAVPVEQLDAVVAAPMGDRSPAPRLLFVGRLSPEKNALGAVSAFVEYIKRHGGTAIVCGDGPQRSDIESLVRREGLERSFQILGFHPEPAAYMKAADVFVSPSLTEGNPNGVLEAVACACPVVVSDIPAHRDILDDSTAEFVAVGDTAATVAGIERVISRQDVTRERAHRARRTCEGRGISSVASRYVELYSKLISAEASSVTCAAS